MKKTRALQALHVSILSLSFASLAEPVRGEEEAQTRGEAQPGQNDPKALTLLSLEQLMDVQVISVARKPQKLAESAAAIHVISQEDIRRSGMSSIPELLRLAPGINVAQFDGNKWAISSRGFNEVFSSNLLVLVDGRTVYSPIFSGVYWDVQDFPLEDIERIEVIRGPGGTLWGANAVNGVINIITKRAKDTQGGLLTAGVGNIEQDTELLRYGGKLGESAHYRVYAKHFDRSHYDRAGDNKPNDAWNQTRSGFRLDWEPSGPDSVSLQGDTYAGTSGENINIPLLSSPYSRTLNDDVKVSGGYLRARWQRTLSAGSDLSLQFYYDHTDRKPATLEESRDTYDLDFQHRFPWWGRHELIWGLGYRLTQDETIAHTFSTSFNPASKALNLYSVFVQDESRWMGDRVRFIIGSKVEHNDFTGFQFQPNARLLWKPAEAHTLWASASRAVRTPSRGETAVRLATSPFQNQGMTFLPVVFGNPGFRSETLLAYEFGYRSEPFKNLSVDAAAFYHDYDHLNTTEAGNPYLESTPAPAHFVIPLRIENKSSARVYGIELEANWRLNGNWRLSGSYTLLQMHFRIDPASTDTASLARSGDSPQQQWQFHSYFDLPHHLNLDAALYYVDRLSNQQTLAYTRIDLRLGWQPVKDLELSLAGRNLLDGSHREFGSNLVQVGSEVPRSLYAKLSWHF
ncbi:MAG: TonB-dependent receptor [Methylococcaceae bacterium]|nr:TonB-dependent receptor [Methylococcaceae bacterium]